MYCNYSTCEHEDFIAIIGTIIYQQQLLFVIKLSLLFSLNDAQMVTIYDWNLLAFASQLLIFNLLQQQ